MTAWVEFFSFDPEQMSLQFGLWRSLELPYRLGRSRRTLIVAVMSSAAKPSSIAP